MSYHRFARSLSVYKILNVYNSSFSSSYLFHHQYINIDQATLWDPLFPFHCLEYNKKCMFQDGMTSKRKNRERANRKILKTMERYMTRVCVCVCVCEGNQRISGKGRVYINTRLSKKFVRHVRIMIFYA